MARRFRLSDVKIARSFLLIVLLAPALVVVGASSALACSCIPARPDPKAITDAAAVFSGTMVEADVAEPGFSPGTWTFEVDAVYKGDIAETQAVTSHTQSAACGLEFEEQKRYVVFAYEEAGDLQTNSCTNTRPLEPDEELSLKPVTEYEKSEASGPEPAAAPEEQGDGGWDPFVVGSFALIPALAILTVVALSRRRR